MASWQTAWKNAEDRIFGYFQNILGGDLNKTAFIAEMPKDFEDQGEDGMWSFVMNGGGTPLDDGQNVATPGAWVEKQMDAEVRGVWNTRARAMEMAGLLMDALPIVEDSLDGIYRIIPRQEPRLERITIQRKADQDLGGEVRVWTMTYELAVIFKRTEV